MSVDTLQPPQAPEPRERDFPALRPELQPLFNLAPGAFYEDESSALRQLASLPYVASEDVQKSHADLMAIPDIQFPVERLVSATRPIDNWAAQGEHKMTHDGRRVLSIDNATMFARAGNYKDRPEPIRITLFADSTGEVWGRVEEGISRTIASKLAGERTLPVVMQMPEDLTQLDRYAGDIVAESEGRSFYDPRKLSGVAIRAMAEGRDMRDVAAEAAEEEAWSQFDDAA